MSDENHPPDPVRIVYHTENRTFARLFHEHSLDQLKNVVRRKLGLGRETDVSLKQTISGSLVDLEDDDDFEAFRVWTRSCVSADIRVTVGRSRGEPVPVSAMPGPASKEPVVEPLQATTTTKKTAPRKRKVSVAAETADVPDKPSEPVAAAPAPSASAAEAAPKLAGADEPPKKRRKKEKEDKTKDADKIEEVQPADAPKKPRGRKAAAAAEVVTSTSKDGEASETAAKKERKRKKDDDAAAKTTAAPAPGMDPPVNDPINDSFLQPASDGPVKSSKRGKSKGRQTEKKIGVCAAIPRTRECTSVQSEVAAAILSRASLPFLPPPPPPPKRKSVRRDAEVAPAATSALPAMAVPDVPVDDVPIAPTEPRRVTPTIEPRQEARGSNGPSCPICLEEPFHIRYRCPIVLEGPDAIRERLEQARRDNTSDQQSLIKDLEGLLCDAQVTPETSPPADAASREASQLPDAAVSGMPNIPSNSKLSEVTVEGRDEGSSSESSDEEAGIEPDEDASAPGKPTLDKQPFLTNDDELDAVIRGPMPKRQSVLGVLDRIVNDEVVNVLDSEEDEGEEEDEEGLDEEELERTRSWLSKTSDSSSATESEEDGSRAPSPLLPDEDVLGSGLKRSDEAGEGPREREGDDVIMGDSVDSSVPGEQEDRSSQAAHVASDDRMAVDDLVGEKDPPSNEPQESGQAEADRISDRDVVGVPVTSQRAEADPIEPSDNWEPPTRSLGVARRLKTRNGQILDDDAERPVLVEQLAVETTTEATPVPTMTESPDKSMEVPASQEPASTRKVVVPSTDTPAAVALLHHRARAGMRSNKASKTPAELGNDAQNGVLAATPSSNQWTTLEEPVASPMPDEPSMLVDELASSPHPEARPKRGRASGRGKMDPPRTPAASNEGGKSQAKGKGRLFDVTSSQIPFPYSQHKTQPVMDDVDEVPGTDSEGELGVEATVSKKRTRAPAARYRSLSQLASQAALFSPSLPTPTNKVTNGKHKGRVARKELSSSSSSSSEDEGSKGSEHIPRGRRAGAVLETQKKKRKKSLLSRIGG